MALGAFAARTPETSVLDFDPDLGSSIRAEDWEVARSACPGGLVRVPSGRWVPPAHAPERRELVGLLIVTGLVCREVGLGDRHMLELLGPGDVLQLPVENDDPLLGSRIELTAALDSELIALGRSFIAAAARWPCLLANVHDRLETQRANLAVQGVIVHLPRAEHRLLLILRHLADRWGFVTAEGTVLPLPLSHDLLAQLAGARRSTITLAVSALERDGVIRRTAEGGWLLTRAAERRVQAIAKTRMPNRTLGETLGLRLRISATLENARALLSEARVVRSQPVKRMPGSSNSNGAKPAAAPATFIRE